jgi:general secretion pathway protein D
MGACVAGLMLLAMTAVASAEEGGGRSKSASRPDYPTISMFELIDRVAKKTGKRFVVDPRVNMEVPLPGLDARDVDYEALLMIFRVQQVATFSQDGIVNVMPDANARQFPTPVLSDDDPKIGPDELVTRVVRLENICANWLVPILRPLMPQAAHMVAHQPSSSLILSDRAADVRRVAELIRLLDRGPKQTCKLPEE